MGRDEMDIGGEMRGDLCHDGAFDRADIGNDRVLGKTGPHGFGDRAAGSHGNAKNNEIRITNAVGCIARDRVGEIELCDAVAHGLRGVDGDDGGGEIAGAGGAGQ